MALVREILEALESIAPPEFALPGDKIGLQIGDPDLNVTKAVVSLDRSLAAIHTCRELKSELLLTHHPVIWQPLTSLVYTNLVSLSIRELVRTNASLIAAHSNWDCAQGGVNDALAVKLGLREVTPFGSVAKYDALKLVTFCPAESVDAIFDAAAAAGAGTVGGYQRCGFSCSGEGTFEASLGAKPAVGEAGRRNRVAEVRLEMELIPDRRSCVESAVRAANPYEEPAIDFLVSQKQGMPIGRKGRLPKPMSIAEFRELVDRALGTRSMAWEGRQGLKVEWVGAVGGAGDDEWQAADSAGCDVLVTGEVKQHNAMEATGWRIHMLAAGHYATEQPGVEALAEAMRRAIPSIEWQLFTPNPGNGGRPI